MSSAEFEVNHPQVNEFFFDIVGLGEVQTNACLVNFVRLGRMIVHVADDRRSLFKKAACPLGKDIRRRA